jgi:hypothetical protein
MEQSEEGNNLPGGVDLFGESGDPTQQTLSATYFQSSPGHSVKGISQNSPLLHGCTRRAWDPGEIRYWLKVMVSTYSGVIEERDIQSPGPSYVESY